MTCGLRRFTKDVATTLKLAGLVQFSGTIAGFSGCAIVNVAAETVREAYKLRVSAQNLSMTDH